MGNVLGRIFIQQSIDPTQYLKDKVVVIDGNLWIHKYCSVFRDKNGELFKSRTGIVTSHIYGMLNLLAKLKKICKHVIFIIESEGKLNKFKLATLVKRKLKRTESLQQYTFLKQNNVDSENPVLKRLKLQSFRITKEIYETTEQCLTYFGMFCYRSQYEGELQCAKLIKKGLADVCLTDDWDIILYNVPVVRNLRLDNKILKCQYVNVQENMLRLEITQAQLVEMCMLTGNDYFGGVKGIGPINALKLIKKYGSISKIVEDQSQTKYDYTLLKTQYKDIINYLDLSVNTGDVKQITYNKLNILGLKNFLIHTCGFSAIKIIPFLSQLNEESDL